MSQKIERRARIKAHIRHTVKGTAEKPRLSVFRSNKQIYAQLIDDTAVDNNGFNSGKTIASANSLKLDKVSKGEQAAKVGEALAAAALAAGVKEVVFDRNGYLYHGRVKELADGARKGGLKF